MNSTYDFSVMRILRKRLGMTLEALAEAAGRTYTTVESVETNKTMPSLKTLDAIAGALGMRTSTLVGLAERRLVQKRQAVLEGQTDADTQDIGLENCKVARYDKGKLIRVTAEKGDHVHVMQLHDDVHEFCYVLSGCVELRVQDKTYELSPDDTILFDGVLDHSYTQIETGEYVTVHIPKDISVISRLIEGSDRRSHSQ